MCNNKIIINKDINQAARSDLYLAAYEKGI